MDLRATIAGDLQRALKERQATKVETLRLLQAALQNEQIAQQRPLDDQAVLAVLRRELKQRQLAAGLYQQGGRAELAEREAAEAAVLQAYLPPELPAEELRQIVSQAAEELRTAGVALNVGAVMKLALPRVAGRADGRLVSQMVTAELQRLSVN